MRNALIVLLLLASGSGQTRADELSSNVHLRGDFNNARLRFERDGVGHVAFIGGSITEMNGYRPMVCQYLQERFPKTKFTFTDAGISSTCSTTGAFRLEEDVLSKGPVDLFFVEFAVNDDQDAMHAPRECRRGIEGILRHALTHNPKMDIVVTYFVNEGMLALLQQGKQPVSIQAHETVADHYGVTTSLHAQEVADQITAGKLTWKEYGGVHPAPRGNAIAAGLVRNLLEHCWSQPLNPKAQARDHQLPEMLDPSSYSNGRFLPHTVATLGEGWQEGIPDWKEIPGSFRSRFANVSCLYADHPGAELKYSFEGTSTGAYVLAGPDAGQLEVSIDGGKFETVNLFHSYSKGLHYPRTVMLATDLKPGKHDVVLRVSSGHADGSKGTAARIMHLTAN